MKRSLCGRKKLPFAGYSVVKEHEPNLPCGRLAHDRNFLFYDPRAAGRKQDRENLVENTGLEPVTSWLQTRRSPS
jgi:hypothetical protein